MKNVIRANQVKFNYEELKNKWDKLLEKYFLNENELNPKYLLELDCPHCSHKETDFSFSLKGFDHHSCSNCKSIYVNPRLNNDCLEELYNSNYYNEVYELSMIPAFERRKSTIGKRKTEQLLSYSQIKKYVYNDVAGIGEVLDVFKDHEWETHAIEMNPVAIDWLNKLNFNEVFHGTLDNYETNLKFDIIMAWGVIEHVTEPDLFLKRIFSLLNNGGIFVSEVPHGESLLIDMVRKLNFDPKRILMGEQHIILYSTEAYINLHLRNDFKKINVRTNGLDCDTIFKENKISVNDDFLSSMQESIDNRMYGDLLRGFWKK